MSQDQAFDLLVIGGGINGVGIARDAAGRGLKVLLCEQGDLGHATSSSSSKLIHGGLRYLEQYAFRLVREALIEREVLLAAAPHIIWPLRFVLPHVKELRPAWMLRAGLFLYDHLGGRERLPASRGLDLRRDPAGEPLVAGITKGFSYADCWVEDSRLVVLNALDAAERGAEVLTRTRCRSARRDAEAWTATLEAEGGEERRVRARALVNAAGPWVMEVLGQVAGANRRSTLRLIKGSHIVVPKLYEGDQAYILQAADQRVVFVIPYEGAFSLIGTTDVDFLRRPGAGGDHGRGDRLPLHHRRPLLRAGAAARGRGLELRRGPAALRRRQRHRLDRDPGLRLRPRCAAGHTAAAVRLRRQRSPPTASWRSTPWPG